MVPNGNEWRLYENGWKIKRNLTTLEVVSLKRIDRRETHRERKCTK